jgi:hypothetical protein
MIALKNFSQTDDFRTFMQSILKVFDDNNSSYLQGFVVARHPTWNWLRRIDQEGWENLSPDHNLRWSWSDYGSEQYYTSDQTNEALLKMWHEYYPSRKPFVVKVCVGPTRPATLPIRRTLQAICARQTEFFGIVEDRAPATLISLEGGRSLTAGSHSGTIGGFLKDQHGNVHGVTCGHVGQFIGNSVSMQDVSGTTVTFGSILHTNWPLVAGSSSTLCQPSTAGNQVDMALTDLGHGQVATNQVRGVGVIDDIYPLSSLGSGHRVRMSGALTGADDYDITGYVVTYRVNHKGSFYFFSNVFEIAGVPIPGLLSSRTPTPKAGDSGGWVCCASDNGGNALCGMVFAADHGRGYVCFTDEMKSWASKPGVGLDLYVL